MGDHPARGDVSFGVCICTRNRPSDLANALRSLQRSTTPIAEVVVSDDSTDDASRAMVLRDFPETRFVEGPRRGLSANRNCAIDASSASFLLFLDDDAALGNTFFAHVSAALGRAGSDATRLIVSGLENQYGRLVEPSGPTFLGYQMVPYRSDTNVRTVVINAAAFPRTVFDAIRFDENLVYGCEELDISTRAVATGYQIVLDRMAINDHFPSPLHRAEYATYRDASRLYVAFKRYAFVERRPLAAALFVMIAPLHLFASIAKRSGPSSALRQTSSSVRCAVRYLRRYLRHRTDAPHRIVAGAS